MKKKNNKIAVNISRSRKKTKRKKNIKHRKKCGLVFNYLSFDKKVVITETIRVPKFFSYLDYPLECNYFFFKLRLKENCSFIRGRAFYKICFRNTLKVDFAAVSILKSIMEEARLSGIIFTGSLPKDADCKNSLLIYGFLNNLSHNGDSDIKIESNGEYLSYEKKSGMITVKDFQNFEDIAASVSVTGDVGYFDEVITILKEIGSNAVEWSHSKNKQWMIGFYREKGKIILNVTDLGRGILETLFRDQRLQLIDIFNFRGPKDILERAFLRKYGSLSQEVNRNRGLPFIRRTFEENKVKNLIVSTNNIFYNFEEHFKSKQSTKEQTNFLGTFYQWEVDEQCVKNYE